MEITLESKAISILETYEGSNNYILELKRKSQINKKFYPTRSQSEYIIHNHTKQPKVAKKWVVLDSYFAQKFADDKLYPVVPEKVWVEKLLAEKEKAYHIWGRMFDSEELHEFWVPKASLIKDNTVKNVVIDYEKYSHRPPLNHQKEAIQKLVENKKFILADDMGLGKALEVNTKIYTSDGIKRIGDMKVGDKVIGSDGNSHNVTGVYPQGIKDLYRITFNDGYSILCCDEHIWTVSTRSNGSNSNSRKTLTLNLTTKQLLDKELKVTRNSNPFDKLQSTYYLQNNGQSKWQIPIVKPITFNNNEELPIHPYLLGLILGDGGITGGGIKFSSKDDEIIDEIKKLLTDDLEIKKTSGDNCDYDIVTKIRGKNSLTNKLRELNLMGRNSSQKFIPEIYKYSSIENRLLILQGLMDTDGFCNKSRKNNEFSGTEFCSISEQLTDDVIEIVHTLGGIARKSSRIPKYTYNGEKKNGKRAYRVNIKLQSGMNPFKLQRKKELYKDPQKYKVGRYIKKIEFERKGDSVCISVDSPDKLYVAEHCIVTHNTTSTIIAALETEAKKVLIICPATLKINWKREIENYTDRSIFIAESKNFSTEHDFVIINYDIIKNFHNVKDKENSEILKSNFDLVIIDESHYIKNAQAQRTKLINDIVKNIDRLWLLTGTPMTSRPIDYYNLLSLVDSPVAKNWMAYVIRYCSGYQFKAGPRKVWNVMGASNLEELRDRTSGTILRRLKEDVLDLPDKIITPIYIRLKSKNYEDIMGEYYDWYDKNPEESKSLTVQFSKLTKVRQVIADEKISHTIELAENILEQGKKVIIFCNFTDSLNRICEHFGKSAVKLDGSMSKQQKQYSVDEFQTNDKIKVFVGNVKAAGVGITLTSAEAVIMNDLSFLPSDHAQAEDRSYRYGQKNNVLVYYPIFENTVEGIIYDIINAKKQVIATVLGDNITQTEAAEEILQKINNLRNY